MPWYKGNFHCHSTNSDGHSSPVEVAASYRAMGMDFVTLSDHNVLTAVEEYAAALGSDCVGIPCCEYTGNRSAHVVAVDVDRAVAPGAELAQASVAEILQDGITQTAAAGGVAVLCHPCWNWTFEHETILGLEGVTHFEVFNAAPDCNSYPTGGRSAPEEIWDRALSAGARIYGVATDDAHQHWSAGEGGRPLNHLPLGGRGWVVVKAAGRSREAIRRAFEAGRFYASTGVELATYRVTREAVTVGAKLWAHERVVTEFIGAGGEVLDRQVGTDATYRFTGRETYVRARLADTGGCFAFTQPVFLDAIDDAVAWTAREVAVTRHQDS